MLEYTQSEHKELYNGMSEDQHQKELFSWATAVENFGVDVATKWVMSHPLTLKREKGFCRLHSRKAEPKQDRRLLWMHSIPNGGVRGGNKKQRMINGLKLKAEGVKNGVPDIFLPLPSKGFAGCYIEMKDRKKGKPRDEQEEFAEYAIGAGYCHRFCYGYLEAIECLLWYLSDE